jgi:hypothetical protein
VRETVQESEFVGMTGVTREESLRVKRGQPCSSPVV